MPPVGWLQSTPSGVTGIHNTPGPFGARRSANCARRASVLQAVPGTRHRASSEAHRASPGRSPRRFRALTGTFGFHRHLRVSDDRPWAFAGGLSYTAGLSRPPARPAASSDDLRLSNGASCSPPSISGCSPEPPGSTGPSSEDPTEASLSILAVSAAIASFRYKGPFVRRPLVKLRTVSGATVVTFESTPDFRLSTDAEFTDILGNRRAQARHCHKRQYLST